MPPTSKLLFTKIPEISSLQYFIGLIDANEKRDESAPNEYQWQVLKSRFLIWKNPAMIAAPVIHRTSHIHIVVLKEFVQDGSLAKCGKEHQLTMSGPYPLTDFIYQQCIIYSLTFRLAPKWNKLDDVFVHSNDFLTCTEPIDSVQTEMIVSEAIKTVQGYVQPGDTLTLGARALRVRLPLLNLVDLGVDLLRLQSEGVVPLQQPVHVLPLLKEGTARAISTRIPPSCPFRSYAELRRHWKNTHGYRLPHSEEGMLFVQVAFRWSCEPYTYPVVCVRPCRLVRTRCRDEALVLAHFVQELALKSPDICGRPLDFRLEGGHVYSHVAELCPASTSHEFFETEGPGTRIFNALPVSVRQPQKPDGANLVTGPAPALTQPFTLDSAVRPTQRSRTPPLFFPSAAPPAAPAPSPVLPTKRLVPIFKAQSTTKINSATPLAAKAPASQRARPPGGPGGPGGAVGSPARPITPLVLPQAAGRKPSLEVDMEVLARTKSLHRASVAMLTQFCRTHSIPVRARERKDLLLNKVYGHFGLTA